MPDDLIYDVGMHNGNDTAFYLACGYRVLAVEADPDLVAAAGKRFQAEIESKRLVILNVAIAEKPAQAEFWINEVASHFNSFDRESAGRMGHPHHSIWVECRRLDDILTEYGTPHYLKIDIEGHDIICCDQLSPTRRPKYISVEMSRIELLLKLRSLGYDRFNLITQADLQSVGARDAKPQVQIHRSLYRLANYRKENRRWSLRFGRACASMALQATRSLFPGAATKPFKSRRLPDWNFIEGCSGTFGEDLPGKWVGWEEIAQLWHRESTEYQTMGREFWCDLHATTSDAAGDSP